MEPQPKHNMNATQSLVPVIGNTYPVKDALKSLGARWNADKKCWMIAADKAAQATIIVNGSRRTPANSRPARTQSRSYGGFWTCPTCGEEHTASVTRCWECGCGRR